MHVGYLNISITRDDGQTRIFSKIEQTQTHQPYTRFGSIFPVLLNVHNNQANSFKVVEFYHVESMVFFFNLPFICRLHSTLGTVLLILRDNIQFGMPGFSLLIRTFASSTTQLKTFFPFACVVYAWKFDKL